MVNVAAVYAIVLAIFDLSFVAIISHTDAVSHAGSPTCFELASVANRSYTDLMFFGAGRVLGLACAAFMSAFKGSLSFDILASMFCLSTRLFEIRYKMLFTSLLPM